MRIFLNLSILRAYITVHKFDVICLSGTYLESSILHDDDNLQIPGYNLYREDRLLNVKKRVFTTKFLFHLIKKCINFEIKIKDKLCSFITSYRSPNQSQDNFESFINNFELNRDSVK